MSQARSVEVGQPACNLRHRVENSYHVGQARLSRSLSQQPPFLDCLLQHDLDAGDGRMPNGACRKPAPSRGTVSDERC